MKLFLNRYALVLWAMVLALAGCKKNPPETEEPTETCTLQPGYSFQNANPYIGFDSAQSLGAIKDWATIKEASGLAASVRNPKLLFVHNDSGHPAILYALDFAGRIVATIESPVFANRDWEDMAAGPGPQQGKRYLYIADIGDNLGQYNEKQVYRFPEPDVSQADSTNILNITAENVEVIRFTYPDGSFDAESFALDPLTNDFYVISKNAFTSQVYKASFPYPVDSVFELERVGYLSISFPTAADFSPDGKWFVLRGYGEMYIWERKAKEPLCKALVRKPQKLPLANEIQGETFAFAIDMQAYYTLSEMRNQVKPVLYRYAEK